MGTGKFIHAIFIPLAYRQRISLSHQTVRNALTISSFFPPSIVLIFQQCLSNTNRNVAFQVFFFALSQISTLFQDKFLLFGILPHIASPFENFVLTHPWFYESHGWYFSLIRQHIRHSREMLSHLVCSLCLRVCCCFYGCVKQRATLFPSSFLLSLLRGPGMDA